MKSLALKNGLWNALSRVLLGAAQFVGSVLIVRGLNDISSEAYGVFSYYATLAGLLMTLGVLALPNALTKLASELRGSQQDGEAQSLARYLALLLLGLNTLLAVIVGIWAFTTEPPLRWYLLVVALTPLFHVLVRILSSLLWGYESYRPVAIASSVGGVVQVMLIAAAYVLDWGITGYLVAVVLSSNVVIPLVILMLQYNKLFYRQRLEPTLQVTALPHRKRFAKPNPDILKRFWHFATPATLVMVFDTIIWQRSEVLFLEHFSTPEQIGFYSLGFSIFFIFVGLGFALVNGYYPAISREYGSGNTQGVRSHLRQACVLGAMFSLPVAFGAVATLGYLLPLVYGETMRPAVLLTKILMASLPFSILAGVLGLTMNAINKIWYTLPLSLSVAVINLTLDWLLIPHYHALGGAVANSTAQLANAVAHIVLVQRLTGAALPHRQLLTLALTALVSTYLVPAFLQTLLPQPVAIFSSILLGASCYLVGLWLFGFLNVFGVSKRFTKRGLWTP
jgi:O-antigen/teichoic acid export membrane protein